MIWPHFSVHFQDISFKLENSLSNKTTYEQVNFFYLSIELGLNKCIHLGFSLQPLFFLGPCVSGWFCTWTQSSVQFSRLHESLCTYLDQTEPNLAQSWATIYLMRVVTPDNGNM